MGGEAHLQSLNSSSRGSSARRWSCNERGACSTSKLAALQAARGVPPGPAAVSLMRIRLSMKRSSEWTQS
eukprot:9115377-Pyramimonas_sp.AAC.1